MPSSEPRSRRCSTRSARRRSAPLASGVVAFLQAAASAGLVATLAAAGCKDKSHSTEMVAVPTAPTAGPPPRDAAAEAATVPYGPPALIKPAVGEKLRELLAEKVVPRRPSSSSSGSIRRAASARRCCTGPTSPRRRRRRSSTKPRKLTFADPNVRGQRFVLLFRQEEFEKVPADAGTLPKPQPTTHPKERVPRPEMAPRPPPPRPEVAPYRSRRAVRLSRSRRAIWPSFAMLFAIVSDQGKPALTRIELEKALLGAEDRAWRDADLVAERAGVQLERALARRHLDPEHEAAAGAREPRARRKVLDDRVAHARDLGGEGPAKSPEVAVVAAVLEEIRDRHLRQRRGAHGLSELEALDLIAKASGNRVSTR